MFLFGFIAGICFYYVAPKLRLFTNYKKKTGWGKKKKSVQSGRTKKKNMSAGETPTMCVNMFSAEGGGEREVQMTAGLFSEAACLAEWRYWVEAAGRPAGGRTVALLNVHPLNPLLPRPPPPDRPTHGSFYLFIYLFLIIRFFAAQSVHIRASSFARSYASHVRTTSYWLMKCCSMSATTTTTSPPPNPLSPGRLVLKPW